MRPTHDWHASRFGRLALTLGGLRLAVPVLIFVAIALAWGTYVDSTRGAKVAVRLVYGSWWFIGLMGLMSVSLVFAVVTRYPWQRKHVGFIIVHSSLIALILGGFWSLFGRVEGRLSLTEGSGSGFIELDASQLELQAHEGSTLRTVATSRIVDNTQRLRLGDMDIEIVERWGNTREESYVADDAAEPFRAIQFDTGDPSGRGLWIGQASRAGGPAAMAGMTVRVLGPDESWTPPPATESEGYVFVAGDARVPLGAEGDPAFPGWQIQSIRKFASAIVSADGLTESDGSDNPAIEVVITDGQGTVERHVAFDHFPDMVLSKKLEGGAPSGARLTVTGAGGETLVIGGEASGLRVTHFGPLGAVQEFESPGQLPWTIQIGSRRLTLLRQVTRARMASRIVERRQPPVSVQPWSSGSTGGPARRCCPGRVRSTSRLMGTMPT